MNAFLTYILEVNIYILIFGFSFYIFFRNETFHRLNRLVILGSIFTAYLIPFLSFSAPQFAMNEVVNLNPVLITAQSNIGHSADGYNFPSILSVLYWIGFGITCYFIFHRILTLLAIRGQELKSIYRGIRIVKTQVLKSPASFFRTIYLTEDVAQESQEAILRHEYVHIREMHSFDLLFMQIVQAFCWFNPVVYRLKNLLEATHEYRADEIASNKNDKTKYSKLLVSQALNINPKILAHQFSKTNHLKRRIMMLHKSQKQGTSILKYFLLIPIISGTLFLNACTKNNPTDNSHDQPGSMQETAPDKPAKMNKIEGTDIYTAPDKMPSYPGGEEAMMKFLGKNIEYPADCKEEGVEGIVYIGFVVDKSGTATDMKVLRSPDERLSVSAMEVIGKMPAWTPGENGGKPVNVQYNLPINYQLR